MARAPVLGGGTLNPFGGAGIDFGAFDIGGTDRESRLILTRVEVRWEAGEATDDEYMAALRAYSTTLAQNSAEWLNNEARVKALDYRIKREIIVSAIEGGTKDLDDLLTFDQAGLTGLVQDSAEYRSRLNTLRNTQAQLLAEDEEPIVEKYGNGKMTTAQLKSWYQDRLADPRFGNNDELTDSLAERIRELDTRIVEERDAATIDKYSQGKMSPQAFIAYATQARGRYAAGTTDYREWSDRIDSARDQSTETALLYRYDLSQQYAQLQAFVASNSKGLGGRTSTSTSKRVVLGADGRWKTVTTTSTKAVKPSASEQKAYQQRQIEIADAKKQMAEIAKKLGRVGGAVGTNSMIRWYTKQLDRYSRGSSEWYAIQGKLDSLNDRKHEEAVMARQGIRISYPSSTSGGGGGGSTAGTSSSRGSAGGGSSGATTRGSAGGGVSFDKFMHAIASVESGGRYNARNASSGAYGKYQIMPANWPSWAQKAGLSANAAQTPENQEKVARAAFQRLFNVLKDWRLVAIAWHSGTSVARDLSRIGPNGRNYVNLVSQKLGMGSVKVSGGRLVGGGGGSISSGSGGYSGTASPATGGSARIGKPSAAAPGSTSSAKGKGPLQVITGISAPPMRAGFDVQRQRTGFPVNLDGEAFKKFYAQYQDAFERGDESFSVNTPGGEVHYFIGDDPLERIDGMKQLDKLRIELFQTRMSAYAGTPSEITAANQFDDAIEDAARNKFLVLSMSLLGPGGAGRAENRTSRTTPVRAPNPLAEGVEMLEERKAGIEAHIKAAETAMKRGDLDAAYAHYQLAASLRLSAETALRTYLAGAEKKIADIERRYGVSMEEALGKGNVVARDLERLVAGGNELEELLATGNETQAALKKYVRVDSAGNVVKDSSTGTGGQLLLNDDYIRVFKTNGQVEFKTAPKGVDDNGKISRDLEGLVKMDVKIGTRTVEAYGEYKVANVGVIVGVDGPIPIKGKVIQYTDPNTGRQAMVMENPFMPGQWSTTPIRYKAPAAGTFSMVPGPGGEQVLQFTTPKYGAKTYTLQLDPKTGVYQMYETNPGGLFGAGAYENRPLGPLLPGTLAADVWGSVWKRDMTGLSGDALYWATQDNPVVGFTAKEHKQWTSSGFSTFAPNATRKQLQLQYGDLFSGSKTSTPGTYGYSEKGGGVSGRERQAQQFGGFGGPRQTSTNAPTSFGGFGGPRLTDPALDRARRMPITPRRENEAAIAKNLRATLPTLKPLPTKSRLTEREEVMAEKRRATAVKKTTPAKPKPSTKKRATSSKRPALKPLPKKKPTTRKPAARRPATRSSSITSRADRSGELR